jgi:hypothetical protein
MVFSRLSGRGLSRARSKGSRSVACPRSAVGGFLRSIGAGCGFACRPSMDRGSSLCGSRFIPTRMDGATVIACLFGGFASNGRWDCRRVARRIFSAVKCTCADEGAGTTQDRSKILPSSLALRCPQAGRLVSL